MSSRYQPLFTSTAVRGNPASYYHSQQLVHDPRVGIMTKNQRIRPQNNGSVPVSRQAERVIREAYRREQEIKSYLADDENFPNFVIQLRKLGLELRDIPGDGNCLFRALADQLEGHSRNHYVHRQSVVRYMMDHRKDFEPFVEDDVPFDVHINSLKKMGTHAGNDAIVAFAKLHNVNVMIHQLSGKPLLIQGTSNGTNASQLHIAYHNGDHYSSIRRINDNTESPANIRLQDAGESLPGRSVAENYTKGIVKAKRNFEDLESDVMIATGCKDVERVRESLIECDNDVDEAILFLLQQLEISGDLHSQDDGTSLTSQQTTTDSGIWAENGTGTRLFGQTESAVGKGHNVHFSNNSIGGSSGYSSLGSNKSGGARPKLVIPQNQEPVLTSRKLKEQKKMEKKKRAEDRHRQRFLGISPEQQLQQRLQQDNLTVIHHDGYVTKI